MVKTNITTAIARSIYSKLEFNIDSSNAINNRIFMCKFEFEEYFNILNLAEATTFSRFRTTNHHLPVETGRWKNIKLKIEFAVSVTVIKLEMNFITY